MSERYGRVEASFTEWDDPATVIIHNGVGYLDQVTQLEITKKLGLMTRGRLVLEWEEDWDELVREGRIIYLRQFDRVATGRYREIGSFLVEKAVPSVEQDGRTTITVSGLGREQLLTKYRHFAPIGEETIYSTTLTEAVAAPWAVTVAGGGAPPGNGSVTLSSDAGLELGDEVRIQLNDDSWFVGTVTGMDLPLAAENQIQYEPRITGAADTGNAVELRKKWLSVADLDGIEAGMRVELELNSGTMETVVSNIVDGRIYLAEGVTGAASSGNDVDAFDYSTPATDDVAQIMARATGWTFTVIGGSGAQGTVDGTAHAPKGESVWELLTTTAEQSGETFRIAPLVGQRPVKQIDWIRTPDDSGMRLVLYSTASALVAGTESENIGVVHKIARESEHNVITRLYPSAADARVTLGYCSAGAQSAAAAAGFSIVLSSDLYEPDYIQYGPGVTEHGVLSDVVKFGNISVSENAGPAELAAAADGMLARAMAAVRESQEREFWRVKVHCHRPLWPGQRVILENIVMDPVVNGEYYVLEVRDVLEKGLIMSYLLLGRELAQQKTAVRALAKELRTQQQTARRATETAVRAAIVAGSGGGGDHGSLSGLTDDDHGQYLRTDGGRTLVGNMAVTEGVTIDGVDLSAHAADPAAHHALVTAADGSLTVSGQSVRIADAAAGSGLDLTSGVLSVKATADKGTIISDDTVAVSADPYGGLETWTGGLRVKRPTHSGLDVGLTGLALNPGGVGANTAAGNSGTVHTHNVLAYADSKTTPNEVMKSSASGDHTLRYLTADKVTTPLVATAAGSLLIEPAGTQVDMRGNLRFTGGARTVSTETGSLRLQPASGLLIGPVNNVAEVQSATTLKTAHWASGFLGTGWGLTYDGHFDTRSIYADELHVAAFIADTARVKVGSEYITPSMALLSDDFIIPAVNQSGTMVVDDVPGLPDLAVFDNNDWVLLRVMSRAGGGLLVANAWGQVSNYVDLANGQQSWTFSCRSTTAAGQRAAGGSVALDFGKSGAGWWWVTAIDPAGAPYAGITTWHGNDPYTDGNRSHKLRLGQLRGVTGQYEWGLRTGGNESRYTIFSDLRSEIHGSRLSLYAGDGAQLRVGAVELRLYRDISNYATLVPNADHGSLNAVTSGGTYYGMVDEGVTGGSSADYIANGTNTGGSVSMGLTDPSPWGAIFQVMARVRLVGNGFSNDTVRLYAQVFAADEVTPLTGEERLYTLAANIETVSETLFKQIDTAATQAQWNAARLRLRWEYSINVVEEAIRLDPQVPSIAVGRGLPTGPDGGGDGFWVGADAGVYKARLGKASGVGLRWTGTALELRNSANAAAITLDSSGNSQFTGAMTIGTSGGIWQGTGTFAAPTTGLKLYNTSGIGRLSTFNAGLEQLTINSNGQLVAGNGSVTLDRSGLAFQTSSNYGTAGSLIFKNSNGATVGVIETRTDSAPGHNRLRLLSNTVSPGNTGNYSSLEMTSAGTIWMQVMNYNSGPPFGAIYTFEYDRLVSSSEVMAMKGMRVGAGLLVGDYENSSPSTGVIRLQQRADNNTYPNSTQIDIFARTVNGVQKLYAKFGNNTVRELASAS